MLSGAKAWLWQRLTAVYLAGYTVGLIVTLGLLAPATVDAWRAFWGHGGVALSTALALVALLWHAWIGLRDVIIDYIHPLRLRVALLSLAALGFAAVGLWVAVILLETRAAVRAAGLV